MSKITDAIDVLSEELLKDPEYFRAWQANIAVQFQDVFRVDCMYQNLYWISNEAAKRFLNLLTATSKNREAGEKST